MDGAIKKLTKVYHLLLNADEWAAVCAGARSDQKPIDDWIRGALAAQVECALDTPLPSMVPRKQRGRPKVELDPGAVDAALLRTGGSRRKAAKILGVSHSTLDRWLNNRAWEKSEIAF